MTTYDLNFDLEKLSKTDLENFCGHFTNRDYDLTQAQTRQYLLNYIDEEITNPAPKVVHSYVVSSHTAFLIEKYIYITYPDIKQKFETNTLFEGHEGISYMQYQVLITPRGWQGGAEIVAFIRVFDTDISYQYVAQLPNLQCKSGQVKQISSFGEFLKALDDSFEELLNPPQTV